MIDVNLRNTRCKLFWSYETIEMSSGHIQGEREITRCFLEFPDGSKLFAGTIKNPKDKSDREYARKQSLRKLIDVLKIQIGLTKEESSFIRKHYYFRKTDNVLDALENGRVSQLDGVVQIEIHVQPEVGS
jgi:hypothetical protein